MPYIIECALACFIYHHHHYCCTQWNSHFKENHTFPWIDPEINFTENACKQLTGVPKVFVKTVLKGIIKEAKKEGVTVIDEAFVKKVNENRNK